MPIVKVTIQGCEYSFAPILVGQLRTLKTPATLATNLERLDFWSPYLRSSLERAGHSLPDVDTMNVDEAMEFFTQGLDAMLRATGAQFDPPKTP